MIEEDDAQDPPSIDDFADRLEAARATGKTPKKKASDPATPSTATALARAWRTASELIAAFIVAGGLGYLVDHLAGTAPWGILVGMAVGFAAGLNNVRRAFKALGADNPPKDDAQQREQEQAEGLD